jgi:hypothetical protein
VFADGAVLAQGRGLANLHRLVEILAVDHRVGVTLAGTLPANEGCVWSFDDGDGHPRQVSGACDEEVKARLISGRPTLASVDIILPDGTALRLVSEILVRDVLIAGMGDSVAAGEGNPDRAVQLSDQGFCFKRFGGGEYYRPGRAGFSGNKACTAMANEDTRAGEWAQQTNWARTVLCGGALSNERPRRRQSRNPIAQFALDFPRQESVCGDHGRPASADGPPRGLGGGGALLPPALRRAVVPTLLRGVLHVQAQTCAHHQGAVCIQDPFEAGRQRSAQGASEFEAGAGVKSGSGTKKKIWTPARRIWMTKVRSTQAHSGL